VPPALSPGAATSKAWTPYQTIDQLAGANVWSPPEFRLSVAEIYRHLQNNENYAGSYGAVKDYVTEKFGPSRNPDIEISNDAYELIVSLDKSSAIDFMRVISFKNGPVFSPIRIHKFFGEAAKLMKSRSHVSAQRARINRNIDWIHDVLHRQFL
jgi:hypothetical protein